jgi:hypothetical protein
MRTVAAWWWFPDEEADFINYLESTGEVVAYLRDDFENVEEIKHSPLRQVIECDTVRNVCLCLKEQAERIVVAPLHPIDNKPRFGIYTSQSEVLGYDRVYYKDSNVLCLGHLHAYWAFVNDEASGYVNKDPAFVKWGKRVFQWIRRKTPEWHQYKSYRATKRVKESVDMGSLQLAAY